MIYGIIHPLSFMATQEPWNQFPAASLNPFKWVKKYPGVKYTLTQFWNKDREICQLYFTRWELAVSPINNK
jgi:hypothetical protein